MSAADAAWNPAADELAQHLIDLAGRVKSPKETIETAFLAMGARLSDCVSGLSVISTAVTELLSQLEGEDVQTATKQLQAVVHQSAAMAEALDRERSSLERLMAIVTASEGPMSDLLRTVRMISMVAINARVATAHITVQGGDFTVFTADIASLSSRTSATVKEVAGIHAQLASIMREVRARRSAFDQAHRGTLSALSDRLAASLAALISERQMAGQRSLATGRLSAGVTAAVGQAVSALQVGDITRQRLEHVEESLEATSAALTSQHDIAPMALTVAVSELQALQLNEAAHEFRKDVAELRGVLERLAGDAQEIARADMSHAGEQPARQRAIVALRKELDSACREIRSFDAARRDLDEASLRLSDSMLHLLRFIDAFHAVEREMRIVSLNLTLQCAKLGDQGSALKVIAQELRSLTAQTKEQSLAIVSGLESARDTMQQMNELWLESGAAQVVQLEGEAQNALAKLTAIDDAIARQADTVRRRSEAVNHQIALAQDEIGLKANILQSVDQVLCELEQLAGRREGLADDLMQHARVQAMSLFGKRYTMAAERVLHERVLGTGTARAEDISVNDNTEAVEDDLESLFL